MKVAIVGAGIIGLYLAWKLGREGHQVTVFEKKSRPGAKVCSCLISERVRQFIPFDNSLIENRINFCQIHFPKKTIRLRFQPAHLAVNRPCLEAALLGLCQKQGVNFLLGQEIRQVPKGFNRIIGCDGAGSNMSKALGLPLPRLRLALLGFSKQEDGSDSVETWPIKKGFCWRIPRGDRVEYGAIGPLKSVKNEFREFCQTSDFHALEYGSKIEAALVPQGLVLPARGDVTLCGDAAGLTKPWSGGGIIWGMLAADILLKNFPDFVKYKKEVSRAFKSKILKAKLALPMVYFLGHYLSWLLPGNIAMDNDSLSF